MEKTLITYFSESGSTEEIAKIIGQSLEGENVEILPVSEVKDLAYKAVIIGTPNWYGKPTPQVGKFIKKYENQLAELPVAFFFSCMDCYQTKAQPENVQIFCDRHFAEQMITTPKVSSWEKSHATTTYLTNLKEFSNKLNLKSIAFFKGRLEFKKISFGNALVMRFICLINKKIKQGDYLQKQDVTEWAKMLKF